MSENEEERSQILITFKGRSSIEFDIQFINVAAAQMLLAAQWLELKARAFIEANERERRARLASLTDENTKILVPTMKNRGG